MEIRKNEKKKSLKTRHFEPIINNFSIHKRPR